MTPEEASAALTDRLAERDRIQANLMDIDSSFGKRLLAGATLTGTTKQQWEAASTSLASVWEIFSTYSAVVRRAEDLLDGSRRLSGSLLRDVSSMLTGKSVVVTGDQVPLAQRALTSSSRPEEHVTLEHAVRQMTTKFAGIAELVSAVESVWNEVSDQLDQISFALAPATQEAAAAADDDVLQGEISAVDGEVTRLRTLLTCDPLTLWQDQHVATTELEQLLLRARSVATESAELTQLRADAARRIAEVASRVSKARACEHDARLAHDETVTKIAADQIPALPAATSALRARLADLEDLRTAGRFRRLAAELTRIDKDAGAAAEHWKEAELAARAVLDRRSELRGLLDAYRVKAGRLGLVEDPSIMRAHQLAHDLLWSAPCDLAASDSAVRNYQGAIVAAQRGKA